MNKTISFIIPVYNEELYILHCLDSIFDLDTCGYSKEVIVVIDGSTDNTGLLLRHYSETHELKILNQENKGLGHARNRGMEFANGDYIYFVDADDCLRPADMRDVLKNMDKGEDIIGINILRVEMDGKPSPYRVFKPSYGMEYIPAREFVRGRNFMSTVCAYFFRREFLLLNGLSFYEGIYHEDEEFTPRVFSLADSFVHIEVDLYCYFSRKNSITTSSDNLLQECRLRDLIIVIGSLQSFLSQNKYLSDCIQCKVDYLAVDTLRLLIRQRHGRKFRKEIVDGLRRKGVFPLRWHWDIKYIAFNLFTRLFM